MKVFSCRNKVLLAVLFITVSLISISFLSPVEAQTPTPTPEDLIYVNAVAWSHDGTKIAAAGTRLPATQGYIRVLDVETGETLYALDPNSGGYTSVAWSHDDRFIALGSFDQSVWVVDLLNKKVVAGLFGHRATVTDVSWSPDGKQLVSSGNWDGLTILWDMTTYKQIRTVEEIGAFPLSVGFSPDGQQIAVGGENGIRIHDAKDEASQKKAAQYFKFNIGALAWNHDGSRIAIGTQTFPSIVHPHLQEAYAEVYIIDSKNGIILNNWYTENETLSDIVWSPDEKWIAAESIEGIIQVWDAESGKLIDILGANVGYSVKNIKKISFSPSGNLIAYGSVIPGVATPNYNITDKNPFYPIYQLGANGIQIFVPMASLERLKAVMQACRVEPSFEKQETTLDTIKELGRIKEQIGAMKSGQISPTCKVDILAIIESLLSNRIFD